MPAYDVVREFEETIAAWAGAKYGVAVESCSAALFLSCVRRGVKQTVIPVNTYPGVPASIIHAGGTVKFSHVPWEGVYGLAPYGIWDGALRFRRGMYLGGLHCLSFHIRKTLSIGRGGMVLCDNADDARWLRLARFDGREECALSAQKDFTVLGYNAYMTCEQAARGLELFQIIKDTDIPDLRVSDQGYANLDLSKFPIFQRAEVTA